MPNKKLLNTAKYSVFLFIGIFLFWLIYKNLELEVLKKQLKNLQFQWIILAIVIGLLSHLIRAYRWRILIRSIGYNTRISNTFFAVMIMYMVNLAIPRGGEIGRCSVLKKYDKVPFTKLFGTIVIERSTDLFAMLFFTIVIAIMQYDIFIDFLSKHPEIKARLLSIFSVQNILIGTAVLGLIIYLIIRFNNRRKTSGITTKLYELWDNFKLGLKSIKQLNNSGLYIIHTVLIYFLWLVMLYVIFFSYEPTSHLSILAGWSAFVLSGLAMVVPVQAGIGAWHFMVYETLFVYGIDKTNGKIFALIAHSSINLSLLFFGFISLIALPVINSYYKKRQTVPAA